VSDARQGDAHVVGPVRPRRRTRLLDLPGTRLQAQQVRRACRRNVRGSGRTRGHLPVPDRKHPDGEVMAFSSDEIQDEILEYLQGQFVQPVRDDYLPNTETVARNALGEIEPYLVVQFGDLQPQNAYAMSGSWDDDYGMPVYVQCISADPKIGRRLANKCIRVLLGRSFPWSGQI